LRVINIFLGHYGIGFGAKKWAPQVSLGTLFLATQFLDLLWPVLVLLGVEEVTINSGGVTGPPLEFISYPISHSLLFACFWAFLLGIVHYWFRRHIAAALVLGIAVLSHWLLDLLVHYPDLPLYPAGPKVGFGLWSRPLTALTVELLIFAGGLVLYTRSTRARDGFGRWGLWSLVLFLISIHLANYFGPPPPTVAAVAWSGLAQWLLVAWGYWLDHHRQYVKILSNA